MKAVIYGYIAHLLRLGTIFIESGNKITMIKNQDRRVAITVRCASMSFLVTIAFLFSACTPVEFYQKRRLVNPIMEFEPDPTELHFMQKTYYSREGSVGGVGTTAGGGCGCY